MKLRVGIFAPSSKVPETEFGMGLDRILAAGIEPVVHPHTLRGHLFFAGTDEERAEAFWELAQDPSIPVLWAARGGYGAARILPLLDRLARKRRKPLPRKLLAGYSDSTALLEYARTRLGWATLHAPMPGLRQFCALPEPEWKALLAAFAGEGARAPAPVSGSRLEWVGGKKPRAKIAAPMVGGNLFVWASLIGTPYALNARGKIVFLEDTDENLYRLDRMVQQLIASGALKGAKAVVLGNFQNCRDLVPRVLASVPGDAQARARAVTDPTADQLVPLRQTMDADVGLEAIFAEIPRLCGVPVARALPVGHGPGKWPLPLGGRYELSPQGELKLVRWEWAGAGAKQRAR
jgi:muramoyltetrapeptide carboxypeptidase